MLRTTVATLVSALVLGAALWQGTDGLRAFTTEGARRLSVIEQPRPVPAVRLIDMQGRERTLADEIGRAVVVEFIYTTCPTICVALGESFAKMGDQIRAAGLADHVRLISISFDLRDSPETLEDYAQAHGADQRLWITARPEDEQALRIRRCGHRGQQGDAQYLVGPGPLPLLSAARRDGDGLRLHGLADARRGA